MEMNNVLSIVKATALGTITAASLLLATTATAGPGKPGENPLAPGGNIVEVALAANGAFGVFDTVLAAAQCDYFGGAVVDILTGEDKVTLFAPVDSAFAELGLDETNVCAAFEGDPATLLTILAYHVTDGRRFSNSVFNRNGNEKEVEMLLGTGYIMTKDGAIYDASSDDAVGIVADFFDINASNGVIHVIDKVLMP
jgi:uncharacterized surface protein with fasciclin (FAS1) repeats